MMNREKDNSTFPLGVETVRVINDGGLGIYYNLGRGPTQFQSSGVRPVLSLEVFPDPLSLANSRLNADVRNGKTIQNRSLNTQAKYSAKCLVKPVIKNSTKTLKWI